MLEGLMSLVVQLVASSGEGKVGQPIEGVVHMVVVRMGPTKNCLGNIVVAARCSKEKKVHEFEKTIPDVGIDVASHDLAHCCLVLYHVHVPGCGSCHVPCHYQLEVEEKVGFPG